MLTPNRDELAIILGVERVAVEFDPQGPHRRGRVDRCDRDRRGAESWTASPDGRTWRDPSGGVGIGVSGSGDVFTGIVTGLCARGAEPE